MNIKVNKYEVCEPMALLTGDMFIYHNELCTVLQKDFHNITIFNHKRNTDYQISLYTIKGLKVTRVKEGTICV